MVSIETRTEKEKAQSKVKHKGTTFVLRKRNLSAVGVYWYVRPWDVALCIESANTIKSMQARSGPSEAIIGHRQSPLVRSRTTPWAALPIYVSRSLPQWLLNDEKLNLIDQT